MAQLEPKASDTLYVWDNGEEYHYWRVDFVSAPSPLPEDDVVLAMESIKGSKVVCVARDFSYRRPDSNRTNAGVNRLVDWFPYGELRYACMNEEELSAERAKWDARNRENPHVAAPGLLDRLIGDGRCILDSLKPSVVSYMLSGGGEAFLKSASPKGYHWDEALRVLRALKARRSAHLE